MSGTFLNTAAILLCGAVALTNRQLSPKVQTAIKGLLGVFTVFVALKLTVTSMGGSFVNIVKQFVIVLISLVVGNLIGRSLRLQEGSNRLGQYAKDQIEKASTGQPRKFTHGFITTSLLFCLTPLALLGALHDGLGGNWQTLAIKAVMDGLATMAFVSVFGTGVVWSALPVLAFQGTLSLGARYLAAALPNPLLADSINATGGMLLFSVALVIFEFRKVRLADMLPSLIVAPLITWFWLVR
jgi:uncharacterized protein